MLGRDHEETRILNHANIKNLTEKRSKIAFENWRPENQKVHISNSSKN